MVHYTFAFKAMPNINNHFLIYYHYEELVIIIYCYTPALYRHFRFICSHIIMNNTTRHFILLSSIVTRHEQCAYKYVFMHNMV